ncbi:putative signal peptide protein [Puccinia sorghi]|uniref:Putative signal peptide protein n=1 Tax=Puccinia sorghi TaxID=27349 RepID=A0A0L6UQN3_9BASI|nr:putative signal peptide protein [Puccinia sorghi]
MVVCFFTFYFLSMFDRQVIIQLCSFILSYDLISDGPC